MSKPLDAEVFMLGVLILRDAIGKAATMHAAVAAEAGPDWAGELAHEVAKGFADQRDLIEEVDELMKAFPE